jgi:hypothetical protein
VRCGKQGECLSDDSSNYTEAVVVKTTIMWQVSDSSKRN